MNLLAAMFLERFSQPCIEMHFFALFRLHEIRLPR
jgi:hypothetical protein